MLARALPGYALKTLLRRALDLAPANPVLNLALSTPPARRLAERIYFHRRGGGGIDREAYLRWLDAEAAGRVGTGPRQV